MLHILGKIFILLLLSIPLSSSVKLIAPSESIKDEDVTFKIVARGFDISFPKIDFIGSELVEELSSVSEAYIINTLKATQTTKTYKIKALKTFSIPSYSITIDGKILKTKEKKVNVRKSTKTISSDYDLQMQIDKHKSHLGERLVLKVIFSYKDRKLEDYEIIKPKLDNFRLQHKSEKTWKKQNGEYIEVVEYYLFSKKEGFFILPASKIEVILKKQGNGFRRTHIEKSTLYSNTLEVDVLGLPKNVSVVGEYKMSTTINKQKVKKGEAIKLQLILEGEGNINNLESFIFEIPNATVYSKNDSNNTLHKSFEIISDENYKIPSLNLRYFDTNKQRLVELKSPSYKIQVGDVKNMQKNDKVSKAKKQTDRLTKIEEKTKQEDTTVAEKTIYFFTGALITLLLIYLYSKIISLNVYTKRSKLYTDLKKVHIQEDFFKKLVPFIGKDKDLDRMIYKLEKEDKKTFKKLKYGVLKLIRTLDL